MPETLYRCHYCKQVFDSCEEADACERSESPPLPCAIGDVVCVNVFPTGQMYTNCVGFKLVPELLYVNIPGHAWDIIVGHRCQIQQGLYATQIPLGYVDSIDRREVSVV